MMRVRMREMFGTTAVLMGLAVGVASAQAPAPAAPAAPPAQGAAAAAAPTYVSIPLEITVNRPAAEVWKRVGKFCDIGEWLQMPCTITSGKDGEFGAVRSVGNEVLVGKTELSYTYTQPVGNGRPYNLYHGTLEARPLTATTSKLSTRSSSTTRCWPMMPRASGTRRSGPRSSRARCRT